MRNIPIIIGREYRERVFKKSFLVTTILVPLFMLLMGAAPTLIMEFAESDTRHITVIDESGLVAPHLESDNEVVFTVTESDLATALIENANNEEPPYEISGKGIPITGTTPIVIPIFIRVWNRSMEATI